MTVNTPLQPTARRRLRRIQHEEIGLQIAPMIDVTLLLLFFFMLSGKLSGGVKLRSVDLPKLSAELEEKNTGEREVLNVEAGGFWGNAQLGCRSWERTCGRALRCAPP